MKNLLGSVNYYLFRFYQKLKNTKKNIGIRSMIKFSVPIIAQIFIALFLLSGRSLAATYTLTTSGAAAAQTPGNWNTGGIGGGGSAATNFTTSGDIFIIASGTAATFGSGTATTFGTNVILQVDGTFTIGTGVSNVTSSLTINGTIKFTSTSTTQYIITNGAGSGSADFTLSAAATLITKNANGIVGSNCSISATGNKSLVNLNTAANYEFDGAAQAMLGIPATVNNLTFSGTNAKTYTTVTTVSGNFIMSGSATATTTMTSVGGNTSISGSAVWTNGATNILTGSLTVGAGATLTMGNFALTVNGISSISGNVNTFSGATGTRRFAGRVTVNSGGVWDLSNQNPATSFGDGITMSGTTFNNGTGAATFSATQSFEGTNQMTFGGTITPAATFTLTNNNTGIVSVLSTGSIVLTGNFIQGAGSTLNLEAAAPFSGAGTFNASTNTNTVNYTGGSQTVRAVNYNNLVLSGNGSTKTFTANQVISDKLIIATGVVANLGTGLSHTATTLSLGGSGQVNGTWGSTSSLATNKNNTFFAATNGLITVSTSSALATRLAITTINNQIVGASFGLSVTIQDANGNTVTGDNSTQVTLAIGTNPSSGILSGTKTVTAISGVATFSGLSIDKLGIGYTLSATSNPSLTAATSNTFNITAGAATKYVVTSSSTSPVSGGTVTISAQLSDANNNAVATAGKTVTWSKSNLNGSFATATSTTDINGLATVIFTTHTVSGTATTITATDNTSLTGTSATITTLVGTASKLSFSQQPGNGTTGTVLASQPIVTIQDANGNTVINSNVTVTLSFSTNTVSGVLSGGLSQSAVNGVVTFSGLSIDKAASDYSLLATSSSLTSATSNPFVITASPAIKLIITGSSSQQAGIAQNITITAKDINGLVATSYSGDKSLTFSGANSSNNTLTTPIVVNKSGIQVPFGSATTITFVNGVASVAGSNNGVLKLYKAESAIISVTDGLISSTSGDRLSIDVSPASANKLAFSIQPSDGISATNLTTQPVVSVLDTYGNLVTNATNSITLAIGSNPNSGVISVNANPLNASSGLASFSGVKINKSGTSYSLVATASGLTSITSSPFNITASIPASITLNAGNNQSASINNTVAIAPSVVVKDANNNPVSGVSVLFSIASGGGSITSATAITNSLGIATIGSWTLGNTAGSNNNILNATYGGLSYTFTASALAPFTCPTFVKRNNGGGSGTCYGSDNFSPNVKSGVFSFINNGNANLAVSKILLNGNLYQDGNTLYQGTIKFGGYYSGGTSSSTAQVCFYGSSQNDNATPAGNWNIYFADANGNQNSCSYVITSNGSASSLNAGVIGSNQSICSGTSAATLTSTSAASGGTGITYQWQKSTTSSTSGFVNIPSQTSATYAPGVLTQTTYFQRIATDNTSTSVNSNVITITVNDAPTKPILSVTQPTCSVATGSISFSSSNNFGDTYSINGTDYFSGGLFSNILVGNYTATVKNIAGCISTPISNSIVAVTTTPTPTITPSATSVCEGTAVTLTSSGTGSGETFQWYSSGVAIGGATNRIYSTNNSGTYTVIRTASNSCSSEASIPVSITVKSLPTAFIIQGTKLASAGNCANSGLTLTASSDASSPSFQWKKSGIDIIGANGSNYTVTSVGNYSVEIISDGCVNTSPISYVNSIPSISSASNSACQGSNVLLSASNGTTFQWKQSGTDIQGANKSTYSASNTGDYSVSVDGVLSCSVSVTINPLPTATISLASESICSGSTALLSASSDASSPIYQWKVNGFNITGATSSSYSTSITGNYTVLITNSNGCQYTSDSKVITVNDIPSISGDLAVCNGLTSQLTGSGVAASLNPWTSSNTLVATVSSSGLVTSLSPGTTTITYTSSTNCSVTASFEVYALPSATLISSSSLVCKNDNSPILTFTGSNGKLAPYTFVYTINNGSNLSIATSNSSSNSVSLNIPTEIPGTYTYNLISVYESSNKVCSAPIANQSVTVVIKPTPVVNVNNAVYCTGGSAILTASGATAYSWSPSANLSATNTASVTANPSTTTTYLVTGTADGCSATATSVVTVNAVAPVVLDPIVGVFNICTNSTTTLTNSRSDGFWSSSATGVATINETTGVLSGVSAGSSIITYTYTPPDGSCSSSVTENITVTAANTVGSASTTPTLCINTPLVAVTHSTTGATGIGVATDLPAGVTAVWSANTITISGTPTVSGTFNYSIPLTGGCGSASATGTITVTAANTINLISANNTIAQTININSTLTNISYSTTGALGASFSGLPIGVTGTWLSNVITINGTPTEPGVFNYIVSLTGGCGTIVSSGSIVVKGSSTISVTGLQSYVYSGSAQGPSTNSKTGSTGAGSYWYRGTGTTTYAASSTAPTVVGTYQVVATLASDANYEGASSSAYAFSITSASSTISVTGLQSYVYSGSAQGPSTNSKTGSTGAVSYSYSGTGSTTYAASSTAPTVVGTYQVVATLASDANYEGASSSAYAFSITSRASTLIPGTISSSQSVCTGNIASMFTSISNASGVTDSVLYKWQQSTDSLTFSDIAGATQSTYNPILITSKTYYKRIAYTINDLPVSSNIVSVNIILRPTLTGSITGKCTMNALKAGSFQVDPVTNATSYVWTLPNGFTGNSTSSTINIVSGNMGGMIRVVPYNETCSGNELTYSVSVVDLSKSTLVTDKYTVSGNNVATANLTMTLYDSLGNRITCTGGLIGNFNADYGTISNVKDNNDGTFNATIASSADTTIISANIGGLQITQTNKLLFTGPQGGIQGNIAILATESPKLSFQAISGVAPFTLIYQSSNKNTSDTLFNVIDNSFIPLALIDSSTTFTLIKLIDKNGEYRDRKFSDDTAFIKVLIPKIITTLKADNPQKVNDSTFAVQLNVKTINEGEVNFNNTQTQLNLSSVFPSPVRFILDSVRINGTTVIPNTKYDGINNTDLFGKIKTPKKFDDLAYLYNKSNFNYNTNLIESHSIQNTIGVGYALEEQSIVNGLNEKIEEQLTKTHYSASIINNQVQLEEIANKAFTGLIYNSIDKYGETVFEEEEVTQLLANFKNNKLTLFGGSSGLPIGAEANAQLFIRLIPNGYNKPFVMQATAIGTGVSPSGNLALSTSLSNDNANASSHPEVTKKGEPLPTVFALDPKAIIGVALSTSKPELQVDNSYDVELKYTIVNYGNLNLQSVNLYPNLAASIPFPATYTIKSPAVNFNTLIIDNNFDGKLNSNLLAPNSLLGFGKSDTVLLKINIKPNAPSALYNMQAFASAKSGDYNLIVTDTSTNGLNPDLDGNGLPSEFIVSQVVINKVIQPLVSGKIGIVSESNNTVKNKLYCSLADTVKIIPLTINTGGLSNNYLYQWQYSQDGNAFRDFEGETDSALNLFNISTSQYIRRVVIEGSLFKYSDTLFVKIATVSKATISYSGSLHLNQNGIINLTSSIGQFYKWNNSDTTRVTTINSAGIYNVLVTDTNGCKSLSDSVIIYPPSPLVIDSTYILGGLNNPVNVTGQVRPLSRGKLQYYNLPIAGNGIATPLIPSSIGNFTYYVSEVVNGIESKRAAFTVTMLDPNKLSDLQKVISMPVTIQETSDFLVGFKFYASNLTTQLLDSVKIEDNLSSVFPSQTKFQIVSMKSSGKLITNPMFDGISITSMLLSSSQISPLKRDSIELLLKVIPNGFVGALNNQAKQTAKLPYGNFIINSNDPTRGNGVSIKYPTSFFIPLIDVFIPDVFTPNRDGFNDRFVIIHPFGKKISLDIFNRWGQKVYANANYNNEWDGKGVGNFMGNDLPEGTYFYFVEIIETITGQKEIRKGYLTLKR